ILTELEILLLASRGFTSRPGKYADGRALYLIVASATSPFGVGAPTSLVGGGWVVSVALSPPRVGDTTRRWGDEPMLKTPLPSEHTASLRRSMQNETTDQASWRGDVRHRLACGDVKQGHASFVGGTREEAMLK